jgi:CHAD domain-containing protein
MVNREKFDYTEWRKTLWNDKTIEEIHQMGVRIRKK